MDFSPAEVGLAALIALLIGITKTGLPGLGILAVSLAPLLMPAKTSTGYILPLLIAADLMAVLYWRKAASPRLLRAVAPALAVGIILGFFLMERLPEQIYGQALGGMLLFLCLLDLWRGWAGLRLPRDNRLLSALLGLTAGVLTMLANAASPVLVVYLLSLRISREEFVGTGAWLYLLCNLFKAPLSASQGLITLESLRLNLIFLPCVVLGGILGALILRRLPGPAFERLMWLLALAGGLKLCLS